MSVKQATRYLQNDDSSSIIYKSFVTSGEKNNYPTLSICLEDLKMYKLYHSQHLKSKYNISEREYAEFVAGNQKKLLHQEMPPRLVDYNYSQSDLKTLFDIDILNATLRFKEIFRKANFGYVNESSYISTNKYTKHDEKMPFYTSYQDPYKICYSRAAWVQKQMIRKEDLLWLEGYRQGLFGRNHLFVGLSWYIYLHKEGQLFKSFNKIAYKKDKETNQYGASPHIKISLSSVTILTKRADSKEACNPNLEDEDHHVRLKIMEKVGCIPVYWKQFHTTTEHLAECKNTEQHKSMLNQIKQYRKWMNAYDPPCEEMTVIFDIQNKIVKNKDQGPKIELFYQIQKYEEISNHRKYDLKMFWSNVGGFVGIFLGFSLSQVPKFLRDNVNHFWKRV